MGRCGAALVACALVAAVTACARPRAQVQPEVPPLTVPLPPPRVLPPLEGGPIEAAGPQPPETPKQRPPARPRADPARNADNAARTEARAEPPKTEVLPGADASGEASGPAPALQLAPAADVPRVEQTISVHLQRAKGDLGKVDYRALNADARMQYDTAKRFITLAEQAVHDRNLIYAQTLADKARVIAGVLLGR